MTSSVIILVGDKMLRSITFCVNCGWPFASDLLLALITKRSIRWDFFKLLLMKLVLKLSGHWWSSWWIWLIIGYRLWISLPVSHLLFNFWIYCNQIWLCLNLILAIKYSKVIDFCHTCTATVFPIPSLVCSPFVLFLYGYHRRQGLDLGIQLLECFKTVPI